MFSFTSAFFGAEYCYRPTWRFWERLYVRLFGLIDLPGRLRARAILPELFSLDAQAILDVGSGTGSYAFYLSRTAQRTVVGLEKDKTRSDELMHISDLLRRDNLRFIHTPNNRSLGRFPSQSFDLVLAIEVLQYLPDVPKVLQEFSRILRPGGYLLGHVPILGHLRPKEKTLFDDTVLPGMLCESGFQIVKLVPTFGGNAKRLCSIYSWVSPWPSLAGLVFPFLLLLAQAITVQNPMGEYRFFQARKPLAGLILGKKDKTY